MDRSLIISSLTALAAVFMPTFANAERNIESPNYTIIKSEGGVELRRYDPYLVAEVTVSANSLRAASSKGFRPLAGYIFGGNKLADKIAMTAPVTTQGAGEGVKIDMTAPVITLNSGDGRYKVHFSMPKSWTMETLPVPNNGNVTIEQMPAETRLAFRFTGKKTDKKMASADQAIMKFAMEQGLSISSEAISAGYDGPMVPTSKRRWEIMRVVE